MFIVLKLTSNIGDIIVKDNSNQTILFKIFIGHYINNTLKD